MERVCVGWWDSSLTFCWLRDMLVINGRISLLGSLRSMEIGLCTVTRTDVWWPYMLGPPSVRSEYLWTSLTNHRMGFICSSWLFLRFPVIFSWRKIAAILEISLVSSVFEWSLANRIIMCDITFIGLDRSCWNSFNGLS
jgi:hypothetical protein